MSGELKSSTSVSPKKGNQMHRTLVGILIARGLLLLSNFSLVAAQVPDGTIKITSRMVAQGVGLSWGEGVLTYKGRITLSLSMRLGCFETLTPRSPLRSYPVRSLI